MRGCHESSWVQLLADAYPNHDQQHVPSTSHHTISQSRPRYVNVIYFKHIYSLSNHYYLYYCTLPITPHHTTSQSKPRYVNVIYFKPLIAYQKLPYVGFKRLICSLMNMCLTMNWGIFMDEQVTHLPLWLHIYPYNTLIAIYTRLTESTQS